MNLAPRPGFGQKFSFATALRVALRRFLILKAVTWILYYLSRNGRWRITLQAAELSKSVYSGYNQLTDKAKKEGWRGATDDELKSMGLARDEFDNPDTGFHADLYKNDNTGKYMLAYRGTKPDSVADWANNITQDKLGLSPQYAKAIYLARTVRKAVGDKLTLTGHSLGGGMASAAAVVTGTKAITFNAAGVNRKAKYFNENNDLRRVGSRDDEDSLVKSYYVTGEALAVGQGIGLMKPAVGERIRLPVPKGMWVTETIDLHDMDAVLSSLYETYYEDKGICGTR